MLNSEPTTEFVDFGVPSSISSPPLSFFNQLHLLALFFRYPRFVAFVLALLFFPCSFPPIPLSSHKSI